MISNNLITENNVAIPYNLSYIFSLNFSTETEYDILSKYNIKKDNCSVVYECYKCNTHDDIKKYINKIINTNTSFNKINRKHNSYKDLASESSHGSYLSFDSNFECGNLQKAIAKSEVEYDLYLNSDTNTRNRCQWFYFAISNGKKNTTVKFNIMNLTKYCYFIKDGMRPLVFSEIEGNWTDKTENIQLSKTSLLMEYYHRIIDLNIAKENSNNTTKPVFYTLSFTYKIEHNNDKVYFALWKPYSYTKLKVLIEKSEVEFNSEYHKENSIIEIRTDDLYYERKTLCYSLGGIPIDILTITSSKDSDFNKKYVVITARMHANETVGSYKIENIITFLLGKDVLAVNLRKEFIFIIVPMVNPDGVVLGNSRCDLVGIDLNRCWKNPKVEIQPSIYYIKETIEKLYKDKKTVSMYCDLHGHSKMLNSFMYVCYTVLSTTPIFWTKITLFPRILSRRCGIVKFAQCQFKLEPKKVIYRMIYS